MPPRGQARAGARSEAGVASLPLHLPAPPAFPSWLDLEMAVPCAQPFDLPDWRFSVDWDGARALLFVDSRGSVRLQGGRALDLTERFPELAAAGTAVLRRPAVLDGVVAQLDPTGRPDLGALCLRIPYGRRAPASPPAVFLATDVLQAAGVATSSWRLDRRLDMLARMIESGTAIQVPEHLAGRGTALAEAAMGRGLTALLARRASSPYRTGMASPERLRIDLARRATCVVAAVEEGRLSSATRLILGEYEGGRLVYAGRVAGPADRRLDAWLRAAARDLRSDTPTLVLHDARMHVSWLRPSISATVAFAARDSAGVLQQTSLVAVRDDVDPAWCLRRDAVPAPAPVRSGGFVPTVLMPLPLDDVLLLPRRRD